MNKNIRYKVRDKVTGKFWNGQTHRSTFNDEGKIWNRIDTLESNISYFIRYKNKWSSIPLEHGAPDHWEIVEVELKYQETGLKSLSDFIKFQSIRSELSNIDHQFGYFADLMRKKNKFDDIAFIFKIKPNPNTNTRSISFGRIKEARAQLRQLGVKSRTYREHKGMFGLTNRDQALKARLVLDLESIADVDQIRKNMGF